MEQLILWRAKALRNQVGNGTGLELKSERSSRGKTRRLSAMALAIMVAVMYLKWHVNSGQLT
jgi:hypothetical protein